MIQKNSNFLIFHFSQQNTKYIQYIIHTYSPYILLLLYLYIRCTYIEVFIYMWPSFIICVRMVSYDTTILRYHTPYTIHHTPYTIHCIFYFYPQGNILFFSSPATWHTSNKNSQYTLWVYNIQIITPIISHLCSSKDRRKYKINMNTKWKCCKNLTNI
jgi:hypothetical protein